VVCLDFTPPNFGDCKKIGDLPGDKIQIFSGILNKIWGKIYHFYLFTILPFIGGLISGRKEAYAYLPSSIGEFLSPQELKRIMGKVGLEDVKIYPLTLGIVSVYVGTKGKF
jgi:demethylmenaquinone methyltransferase/2-methoxy-6-polyprenyl-1,4-benzoquinol methylase